MEPKERSHLKEAPTARALSQALSWCRAVGINCRPDPSINSNLILTKKDGGEMQVELGMGSPMLQGAQEHLVVLAKELASPKAPIALKAFHEITRAAGYGTPAPVDRGVAPAKRILHCDDFELVGFRHREFRRAPNPDPAELAKYEPIMRKICYQFINKNQEMCRRNCLMVEDLMTYAQVYTLTSTD